MTKFGMEKAESLFATLLSLPLGWFGAWWKNLLATLAVAMILVGAEGSMLEAQERPALGVSRLRLSPDGRELMMTYCQKGKPCAIAVLELEGHRLRLYRAPKNEFWTDGNYSPDGRRIVFKIGVLDAIGSESLYYQVAVMNRDGTMVHRLTTSPYYKEGPAFSPSGHRITYTRANITRRTDRGDRFIHFVLCEIVDEGNEVVIDSTEWSRLLWPKYWAGENTIIVDGSGRVQTTPAGKFEGLFHTENQIFMWKRGTGLSTEPVPLLTKVSLQPVVDRQGRVLFLAGSEQFDGGIRNYDLFLLDKGEVRRVTRAGMLMQDPAIAWDGSRIAWIGNMDRKGGDYRLFTATLDDPTPVEIKLPEPSGFVN